MGQYAEGVRLPLNMTAIREEVIKNVKPTTAAELDQAVDTACERALQGFTHDEMVRLRADLLEEASRLRGPHTREEVRAQPAGYVLAVLENAVAIERVLARSNQYQNS